MEGGRKEREERREWRDIEKQLVMNIQTRKECPKLNFSSTISPARHLLCTNLEAVCLVVGTQLVCVQVASCW